MGMFATTRPAWLDKYTRYIFATSRTMETAEAMLVFNKYDEMVQLIQR